MRKKKVYLNCHKFENIDTLCFLIEEENQGWGFEKWNHMITILWCNKSCLYACGILITKGCKMGTIWLCHVFKKLCVRVVDPTTMGELKKRGGNHINIVRARIPFIFWCHGTSNGSYSGGIGVMQSNPYIVVVLYIAFIIWKHCLGICKK
jgi:hypothetical protein